MYPRAVCQVACRSFPGERIAASSTDFGPPVPFVTHFGVTHEQDHLLALTDGSRGETIDEARRTPSPLSGFGKISDRGNAQYVLIAPEGNQALRRMRR